MNRTITMTRRVMAAAVLLVLAFWARTAAQYRLDGSIYENYAIDGYSQETVEEQKTKYYDLFGEHITDGYYVYGFSNSRDFYYNRTVDDSLGTGVNNEYRSERFYEDLNNMVLSQDQIGGVKMLFMVGDQLHTKFTPLTLNKRNFSGMRWDLWSSGLKMTALFSRTRPGIMTRQNFGGNSYVTYPLIDWNDADEEWYAEQGDWSRKTFFGDYDLLFGFHAENKLANVVNWGVTYLNHHHSDIERGEKFFSGQLPKALVPEEIHFEFTDATPDVGEDGDAGVLVNGVSMQITGEDTLGNPVTVTIDSPTAVYTVHDTVYPITETVKLPDGSRIRVVTGYYPRWALYNQPSGQPALPCTVHGAWGVVTTFKPLEAAIARGLDPNKIRSVDFNMAVGGNYQVFASNEKLTPQDNTHFDGNYKDADGQKVGRIKQNTVEYVASKLAVDAGGSISATKYLDHKSYSENYMGYYIAQSAEQMGVDDYSNLRTIHYQYMLPVSNVLYGVNFDGKIGGLSFSGEYAGTNEEFKYPFRRGTRRTEAKHAAYLKLNYDFLKRYSVSADLYNLDPEFQPGLRSFSASKLFFSRPLEKALGEEPGYLGYPRVLDNKYGLIDDNEDDDYYTENDPRKYPAENNFDNSILGSSFYGDGTIKGYAFDQEDSRHSIDKQQEKRVLLPTGMYKTYDDHDGVIRPTYDKNKNGILDYREDFLLYKVDLPVFSMEKDRNNNGVYDAEEDDMYPDYPYQMGYVYTSDGFQSQGIRGLKGVFTLEPVRNLQVNAGGVYQQILDSDLDGTEDELLAEDGKHTEYYLRGLYDINKRSVGLRYYAGAEARRVWDGLKNDAVLTLPRRGMAKLEIDYVVKPDKLRYFNATALDVIGGVVYSNIPNFELTSKVALGYELHNADRDLYVTKSAVLTQDDGSRTGLFRSQYVEYPDNTLRSLNFLTKLDYTFKFSKQYRGKLHYLNVLQQVRIVPQYQLLYIYRDSKDSDPRNAYDNTYLAADTENAFFLWEDFTEYNENSLFTVPIIKLFFKIGEKTMLESGIQWMRAYNFLVNEESYLKTTLAAQIVNRDVIQGYDVNTFFGVSIADLNYDINNQHQYFQYGSDVDDRSIEVFCKIYAGIKQ